MSRTGKDFPIIDGDDENFEDELNFQVWSTDSCSDYRNDRERPYDGQPQTYNGLRGKTEVKGLTMRDIKDCLIKAMLVSSPEDEMFEGDEFLKCWDFSECKTEDDQPKPTPYLLEMQKKGKYLSTKVEVGNWRPQDVYGIDFSKVDPIAICQNLTCEIEKMMGIFPNIDTKGLTKEFLESITPKENKN